jgi:hypothetical protein
MKKPNPDFEVGKVGEDGIVYRYYQNGRVGVCLAKGIPLQHRRKGQEIREAWTLSHRIVVVIVVVVEYRSYFE